MNCPKSGIKIHKSDNDYNKDPFLKDSKLTKPVSFQNTTLNSLDLDLDNYSLEDLYHLFNISNGHLSEESLKSAKQIVLKMHPDKSRLEPKYFLFFSRAYKRLYSIYDFQNKSDNKKYNDKADRSYSNNDNYFDDNNKSLLNNMFENKKEFKDPKNFNSWFNQAFEKHRLDDPNEQGYGDWLKSNDDFISMDENVTKGNMNDVFEQKKKQIQAVTVYNGVTDLYSSTFGASLLDGSSGDMGSSNYTDLRKAYTETLIPVTLEDYNKMEKFNNLSEYKAHRERVDVKPISGEEAERKLFQQKQEQENQSAALAFKYAKEAEKAKEKQNNFWTDLKQITGW